MSQILRTGSTCPVMLTMWHTISSRVRGVMALAYTCTTSSSDLGSIGTVTTRFTMPAAPRHAA